MGRRLADYPGSDWAYGRNPDAQSDSATRFLTHVPLAASVKQYQALTWIDGFAFHVKKDSDRRLRLAERPGSSASPPISASECDVVFLVSLGRLCRVSQQRAASGLSSGSSSNSEAPHLLLWLLFDLQERLHGLWWQPLVERVPAETALQSTWCWCARAVRLLGRVNPLTECYP